MSSNIICTQDNLDDLADAARRAQSLADDLRRMAAGDLPTPAELESAPLIDGWSLSFRPETCLVGTIYGHPSLGLMRPGMTTAVEAFAPNLGWVRTASRFFRLGFAAGNCDDGRKQ
jgi:hypothetical protein